MTIGDLEHKWNDLMDEIRHREDMLKEITDECNKRIWELREEAKKINSEILDRLKLES